MFLGHKNGNYGRGSNNTGGVSDTEVAEFNCQ